MMIYTSIDQYISLQGEEVRPILEKIRAVIHQSAPQAIERIAYQMPTFYDRENLIHFAVFKDHIGIYPGEDYTRLFSEKLKGYKTTKGSIHFPKKEPLDYTLIREIVLWRLANQKVKKK